jgi:unspecific monooxygenase
MPSITVNALGLLCVPVLATIFILFPVTLLRSPLNKVPSAHWSCSLSRFWILWTRYKNRELAVLDEKHRQLGPIIRVGPAELSVSCYDSGVRTIYNGGFEKPEYYDFFAYYDTKNAFCSLSRHDHTLRRKRITAAYTRTSLFRSQQLSSLTEIILFARLLPILQQQALAVKPTDILSLSYALSLDLITCFQFGLSSGSDFLQTPDSLPPWLEHYEHRYCKEAFWPQELPILTRCFNFMGKTMLPRSYFHSKRFLEDWLLEMCDRAEVVHATSAKEGMTHACDTPVVYQLVKSAVDADSPDTSFDARRKEIASELFDEMCT